MLLKDDRTIVAIIFALIGVIAVQVMQLVA
jgi:hypothetical protein